MNTEVQQKFETYIIENQARFYRIAFSHTHNRDIALDAVQNAVVKGLEHYEELRTPAYMDTWFYRILLNECYGFIRFHKRELAYEPQELYRELENGKAAEQIPEFQDKGELEIYDLIHHLPPKMKTVVILRYYEELSLEDIAKIIPCSLSAVKYRLYAGLKHLEKRWKEAAK